MVPWIRLAGVALLGTALWFAPPPAAITPQAWHLFAIFVATIAGLITKPLPIGAVAFIAMSVVALTGTLTIAQTLSGFSNPTIWLMAAAFFMSRGFLKTGLGARVA